jgi:Mpv17 / PMP22 family
MRACWVSSFVSCTMPCILTLCIATGKLWIPATIINIGFVPPILRVLYLNGVFFFWSIYLSLVLNKKEES